MTPQAFDSLALGLAIGAIVLRLIDATWWAGIAGTASFCCSTAAGFLARRRTIKPW
jgi:hypothetical protein